MDIQNMLKQAQRLQQDMLKVKKEIEEKIFPGKYSFIEVEVNGKKEIIKIKINKEEINKDDIEMLEDMLIVAINDAVKKVDKEYEEKMGKFNLGIPGMF